MRLFTPTISGGRYLLDADTRPAAVAQLRADRAAGLLNADDVLALAGQIAAQDDGRLGYAVTPANCAATCATLDLGAEALDAAERREQDAAHAGRRPWWKRWQIWSKR